MIPPPPTSLLPNLKVGDFDVPVAALLRVDPESLDEGYAAQAAWFATLSYQESLIESKINKQARHIKELEASHYKEISERSQKKPAEAAIKALITISVPVRTAYAKLLALEEERDAWSAVRQGLAQKKDMLVNLGAGRRLDQKANLDLPVK